MRIIHYTGNGRTQTLKSIVAAMRAARRGKVDVEIGPLDETLISSLGLFIKGANEEIERFMPLMEREAKRIKIDVEPSEFVGQLD